MWLDHGEEGGGSRRHDWSGEQAEPGGPASRAGFCVPRTQLKG